ncbi:MAG: Ycf51 family protein [Synechococcus sp.]|nr:Ycf51 family protein [Synechococcus sp.]
MENIDFALYTQWSAYGTLLFAVLAIAAFLFKWGIRFRLVGTTGFMIVLTIGLFGLSLGLFSRSVVPGAVRYALVYDNGANLAVVSVKPDVTVEAVNATLQQASNDLFSYGRIGGGDDKFTVRLRVMNHPEPGISEPLYLGQVQRSVAERENGALDIQLYPENFKKLSQPKAIS